MGFFEALGSLVFILDCTLPTHAFSIAMYHLEPQAAPIVPGPVQVQDNKEPLPQKADGPN